MSKYLESNADVAGSHPPGESVPLESVLCTEELRHRPSRRPDYEKESRALVCLARSLADSPRTILQTMADTMLKVFDAGSTGISLLTKEDGGKRFYWPAIAGMWKPHIGGGTPRDFGPCGDVLDRNSTLLFGQLEKRYTYFQLVTPHVQEALLIPFYVHGKAVGTIWAVAHDQKRKFDTEDERLMKSLGLFASSAYQIVESLDVVSFQASESMKAERAAGMLTAIIDSSDDAIVSKNLDGTIVTWNKGAERLFGYAAEEAVGKHISLIIPPDRLNEEAMILDRIKRGEHVEHFETRRKRKDGTTLAISLTISPVRNRDGRVVGASKVARDITERERAHEALQTSEERLRLLATGLENKVRVRTHQLEQRNAEVLRQSDQLRELSRRLLQSQDEERRRIARDLHDSAGQVLSVLGMNLASIAPRVKRHGVIGKSIQESLDLIHQLSAEIRTISYLLHPPLLDENGLAGAIEWYVGGLANRSGLRIGLEVSAKFGRLPGEMETAIFRIVQECLTNIHRHSGSKTASIRLSRDSNHVTLEITDAGKGISIKKLSEIRAQHSGVGIAGMRERIRYLKGVMNIASNSAGTKVSVTLPMGQTSESGKTQHASAAG